LGNCTFGKLPLVKLSFGKMPLGKYLTPFQVLISLFKNTLGEVLLGKIHLGKVPNFPEIL